MPNQATLLVTHTISICFINYMLSHTAVSQFCMQLIKAYKAERSVHLFVLIAQYSQENGWHLKLMVRDVQELSLWSCQLQCMRTAQSSTGDPQAKCLDDGVLPTEYTQN